MVAFTALAVLTASASASLASLVAAHPNPQSTQASPARLLQRWYHDEDHPVHELFRRSSLNGKRADPKPDIGSDAWTAQYPDNAPDVTKLPKAWTDALTDAISAGKIPSVPPSTTANGNSPMYPPGTNENRNGPTVCAATDRVCRIPEDIWDAPTGVMGIGFDDGPLPASPRLYTFLEQNNIPSTHYMIGTNVKMHWREFQQAYDELKSDIAVHTWTHPYMTTQTNEQVLGELGWTMQIIYDSTDGKLPRFWRPPYGDIDTRVSAIAREVFGMTAVMWNQDTDDWAMESTPPATSLDNIQGNMQRWLSGPKTPGLIILEHELADSTVTAFMNAYPLIGQNGWKIVSQAQLNSSMGVYQDGDESDDAFASVFPDTSTSVSSSATSESATSSTPSASTSAISAESNTSGASNGYIFPSLVSLGVFTGGLFILL